MAEERRVPDDPLTFIKECVRDRQIYWTYHVNMRLAGRHITRKEILEAVDTYRLSNRIQRASTCQATSQWVPLEVLVSTFFLLPMLKAIMSES